MKKTILMGIAALVVCGSVNATSWRVCSKPEAGANFLSVAEAVASNSVFAGDTLYLEPGHYEASSVTISKKLFLIGTGYLFEDNGINIMNPSNSTFGDDVTVASEGSVINGCVCLKNLNLNANSVYVNGCNVYGNLSLSGDNLVLSNNIFRGTIDNSGQFGHTAQNVLIENNIVMARILCVYAPYWDNKRLINSIIRNNVFVCNPGGYYDSPYYVLDGVGNCQIYNNIIINTNPDFTTINNADQTIDTIWYKENVIRYDATNTVHNNILSCSIIQDYTNCVFNAKVEDMLIWNGANTLEEKYKHKTPGPAVGAGLNGTTCGAYGAVNGSRPYQPSGIPQYRPYIYDAQIDETPSSNNTINASFKIKVQQ